MKLQFHPITLSFEDENLELEFLQHHWVQHLLQSRISQILGAFLFGIFAYLDFWIIPNLTEYSIPGRLIIASLLVLNYFLLPIQALRRYYLWIWLFLGLAIYSLLLFLSLHNLEGHLYMTALFLVLTFVYILIGLRFVVATSIGIFLLIFFEVVVIWVRPLPLHLWINDSFYIISFNLVGMFACYLLERNQRINYLQMKWINHQNQELETANQQLRDLDQEKNEFLSIAAHDLRSPLNAIVALSGMCADGNHEGPQDYQEMSQTVHQSAKNMVNIISNLLNVSRMENMLDRLQIQPIELHYPLNQIIKRNHFAAQSKEIHLEFLQGAGELWIEADLQWLEQIFENIITNAIKYSPPKRTVIIQTLHQGKECQIKVQDQGPGLTPEDHKKLFTRFGKLSAKPTAGESSVGLGLYIVKKITNAMGGKVWCESEPGHGACFILSFPQFHP